MKRKLTGFLFGRDNKVSGLIALSITALIVLGCTCNKSFDLSNTGSSSDNSRSTSNSSSSNSSSSSSDRPVKSDNEQLIQESLQDFADAVDAGDFAEFRDGVSAPFKKQFTAEKFNDAFKEFINQKSRVVPVLRSTADMTPTITSGPTESTKSGYKVLSVEGKYETSPLPTEFVLEYIKEGGEWKLIKIEVKLKPKS